LVIGLQITVKALKAFKVLTGFGLNLTFLTPLTLLTVNGLISFDAFNV